MAINMKFKQAAIGAMAGDIEQTLIQIHRPEINIASAYRSQDPAIEHYLRGLDIEQRYMTPTAEDPHPQYGVEPAFFYYNIHANELEISGEVPEGAGRTQFLDHVVSGLKIFSTVTGFEDVRAMWRLQGKESRGILCHVDNQVTLRGLETILGDARTLWLPDQHIDWNRYECEYNDKGAIISNRLCTNFKDHACLQQVDKHHMSIHKGADFANPLVHSSPGLCPELNMRPGTRAILTYDQA